MPTNTWPDMPQPEFHSYTAQENVAPDIAPGIRPASTEELLQLAQQQFLAATTHQHEFVYLLNNNHTALRGCSCGLAFVGLMAGNVQDLMWHQVREVEQ